MLVLGPGDLAGAWTRLLLRPAGRAKVSFFAALLAADPARSGLLALLACLPVWLANFSLSDLCRFGVMLDLGDHCEIGPTRGISFACCGLLPALACWLICRFGLCYLSVWGF